MLDPDVVEVGVVVLEDPVGIPEEETDIAVAAPEEIPDVGVVELVDPIGTTAGEPEMVSADLGAPFVGKTGRVMVVDGVEFGDPPGVLEAELKMTAVALEEVETPGGALEAGAVELMETTGGPEETAAPKVAEEPEEVLGIGRGDLRATLFEGEGIVAVLLGDNGMLVLDGAVPLEAGTVVAFTGEGRIVTVVVVVSKAVPEIVPSI